MNAKLTLSLDKSVIEDAKRYAAKHNRSLSNIIENYLKLVIRDKSNHNSNPPYPTILDELDIGIRLPNDFDVKKVYRQHIEDKYG